MIDWTAQWTQFAAHFHDGFAHIPVGPHILRLKPGPGFGDLSHPTTQLVLDAMAPLVPGRRILDIGCGSGILTLASLLLGAVSAHGIDIDEDALEHARENNAINQLSATFSLPEGARTYDLILMNMILSEQRVAKMRAPLILTSGILIDQKDVYYRETAEWGWRPVQEFTSGEWLATLFVTSTPLSPSPSLPPLK